uniref:Uncharacterized protein n=1 Tax=Megaselia scalaris TaxID=36166 RepID=T1GVI5_MEGSC
MALAGGYLICINKEEHLKTEVPGETFSIMQNLTEALFSLDETSYALETVGDSTCIFHTIQRISESHLAEFDSGKAHLQLEYNTLGANR